MEALAPGDTVDALAEQIGVAVVPGILTDQLHVGHPQREIVTPDVEDVVETERSNRRVRGAPFRSQPFDGRRRVGGLELVEVVVVAQRNVV
jgi:hypothetical protein